jgi:hypothetical protein
MGWKLTQKILGSTAATPISATNIRCSQAWFQSYIDNVGNVFLGDSTVATSKGICLIPDTGSAPLDRALIKPAGVGNNIDLNHIYLKGASGDGVTCFYEEF